MTLAQLNCTEVSAIDTFNKNTVLRFENRIKCLNSVFWNLHQTIENNERVLLVIDHKEDLEYINYFLSKHKLKQLSVIINPSQEYISQPLIEKFNDKLELQVSSGKIEDAKESIAFLSDTILKYLSQLRQPKLGKLNILEIFERKKVTPLKNQILEVDFYQLVPFDEFKTKKSLVIKAFNLYKPVFKFTRENNILKHAFILNMSPKGIKSVFNDIQEELNNLLVSINTIKSQIEKEIEQTYLKQSNEIHRCFFEISKIKSISNLTDTDIQKLNHLCDKFDSKLKTKTSHLPMTERMVAIENTYQNHVKKLTSEKKLFGQYTLQRINMFNGGDKALEIFKKLQLISKKIAKTHAFKDIYIQNPCSLFACNQICEDLINKLDYAEYFIENSQEYIEWLYFKNGLKTEERTIINELTKVKFNWAEVFESNYLEGFLNSELINLFDIESSYNDLCNKLSDYEKQVAYEIHSNFKADANKRIIPNAEGSETKISWVDFFSEFGAQATSKFPIVILDSRSYEKHANSLQTLVDKSIFLNNSPKVIPTQAWNTNVFVGYSGQFVRDIVSQSKKYNDVALKNFIGVEFNVNRSIKQLNNSERNMLALFLGQSLHKLNSTYRIFQLKSKSIISFLKDDKNAQLLQSLAGYGCKEIFSQEENVNLLPGIIADPNTESVLLLEDNLFVLDSDQFNFDQLVLLNKVKEAGIKTVSVNNYKTLTDKEYTLDKIIANMLRFEDLVQSQVKG